MLQTVGEKVLPHLVEHLAHEDAGVRKFIVDIMGGIGSATILPELTTALADSDANVAAAAAESLGMIGDAVAVPSLLKALERDDLLIRYAILEALVKIGTPVPLGVITPLAGDPLLKKALFECLGVIGDLASAPLLVEGLIDRARNVREAALTALDHDAEQNGLPISSESLSGRDCRRLPEQKPSSISRRCVKVLIRRSERLQLPSSVWWATLVPLIFLSRDTGMKASSRQCLRQCVTWAIQSGPSLYNRYVSADEEERCIIMHIAGELDLAEMQENRCCRDG